MNSFQILRDSGDKSVWRFHIKNILAISGIEADTLFRMPPEVGDIPKFDDVK